MSSQGYITKMGSSFICTLWLHPEWWGKCGGEAMELSLPLPSGYLDTNLGTQKLRSPVTVTCRY
jgi:hypothetical protein